MPTLLHQLPVIFKFRIRCIALLIIFLAAANPIQAQCPPNIDFEYGDFTNWQCWTGVTYVNGANENVIDLVPAVGPIPGRHTMLSSFPGDGRDPFGLFPVNCPNGSGKSIKLGNDIGGAEAEGLSYTFTIPANQNTYSLIYNYAVVFQGPEHFDYQQPRMVIEIRNLTDNQVILCSSFNFFYSTSSPTLPGFFLSTNNPTGTPVWCKDWTATSIKLDGLAGKTIQLFFKTADCVFSIHFGYAYIDVNSECSSSFTGATYCPDDAFINVTAPFGYETYTWWDAGFTTILGNTQTINFTPPPPSGSTIAVELKPFNGFGCLDTLYANLFDTLTLQSFAGPDRLSCNGSPVQLGANSRPGLAYSWSPVTGLNDPTIANPVATTAVTTEYIITTTNAGGGCATRDTMLVTATTLDSTLTFIGDPVLCFDGTNPDTLRVSPADSIQWYRDNVAIPGATQTELIVFLSGTYHATLFSFTGCTISTSVVSITVNPAPTAGFDVNIPVQCMANNQFSFTNTSTIASGTLQFTWDFGDGTGSVATDPVHSYTQPGTYTVKLIVSSDQGCADSITSTVTVNASPLAGFTVNTNIQCLKNNSFVFSNTSTMPAGNMQYQWYFGDGNTATTRDVNYSYAVPGSFTVKLVTSSNLGCADSATFDITVNPSPVTGFNVANPQQCFTNNQFNFINISSIPSGTQQFVWTLGDGTTSTTTDVTHSYAVPGDYTVKLVATSDKGCADSSSFNVKVHPYAIADFFADAVCINLPLPLSNKTINNTSTTLNYLWDFGNGQTSTLQNPVYSYPSPGNYTITLSVNTSQCPQPLTVKQVVVVIDAPETGITYAEKTAIMNFPEPLQARPIGTSVLWTPSISLDDPGVYNPVFKGLHSQLYYIRMQTPSGCLTVDTQLVKTRKKIEIYVPNSFTPNADGLNDYLRPVLMGISTVNYFRVYNRWGKLLYQAPSARPGWDGRINGQRQDMQTVVWMIEAVDVDGYTHKRQGTSILLR
ncbi:MAG: PKD domain-containing protein [Chitinophagaceae bacterium]|nr:PKD domain-containing protein [Chitinophagaceae bacterium]